MTFTTMGYHGLLDTAVVCLLTGHVKAFNRLLALSIKSIALRPKNTFSGIAPLCWLLFLSTK